MGRKESNQTNKTIMHVANVLGGGSKSFNGDLTIASFILKSFPWPLVCNVLYWFNKNLLNLMNTLCKIWNILL